MYLFLFLLKVCRAVCYLGVLAAFKSQAGQNLVDAIVALGLGQRWPVHLAREHKVLANCGVTTSWREGVGGGGGRDVHPFFF